MTDGGDLALAAGTTFVADLHLDVAQADFVAPFVRFVDGLTDAPALVVLGDLFDAWVGPAQARLPGAPPVLDALARLVARGTAVHVVPGNRDFLLERSFTARTGVTLHPEGFVARHGAERVRCVHGDTLCTRDVGYLRLRRVLRSAPVGWVAPRVPLWLGTRIARRLRRASTAAVAAKLPDEKSIQRDAVRAELAASGARTLVCGHAHEWRDETFDDGTRWIVLDAFGAGARDVLVAGAGGVWRTRSSRHPA